MPKERFRFGRTRVGPQATANAGALTTGARIAWPSNANTQSSRPYRPAVPPCRLISSRKPMFRHQPQQVVRMKSQYLSSGFVVAAPLRIGFQNRFPLRLAHRQVIPRAGVSRGRFQEISPAGLPAIPSPIPPAPPPAPSRSLTRERCRANCIASTSARLLWLSLQCAACSARPIAAGRTGPAPGCLRAGRAAAPSVA